MKGASPFCLGIMPEKIGTTTGSPGRRDGPRRMCRWTGDFGASWHHYGKGVGKGHVFVPIPSESHIFQATSMISIHRSYRPCNTVHQFALRKLSSMSTIFGSRPEHLPSYVQLALLNRYENASHSPSSAKNVQGSDPSPHSRPFDRPSAHVHPYHVSIASEAH
jgi:hypothetical protein